MNPGDRLRAFVGDLDLLAEACARSFQLDELMDHGAPTVEHDGILFVLVGDEWVAYPPEILAGFARSE